MRNCRLNRTALIALVLIFALVEFGVSVESALPTSPSEYPIVDGSTSTQPLGVLLACRLTGTAFAWGYHPFNGTRRLCPTTNEQDPLARLSLEFPPRESRIPPTNIHKDLTERTEHHGTHESYKNLISGSANLIIAARDPSEDELKLAEEKGVKIRWAPIAYDAFVFIVNTNNPITSLSVEQIRLIYTGSITNWDQVGGISAPINAYQRNRNSGSQEKMEKLVMKGLEMIQANDLEAMLTMMGPFNALRRDKNGLGYTVQYYDTFMVHTPEVKTIAVDGVQPSAENILGGKYLFISEVVLAWLDDLPAGGPAEAVRDWILSDAGQQIARESGYVPLK